MALVDSLLTAMVRANGDALVMHVGERPYVVRESGTIDLSTHGLNLDAMTGMLAQLLPAEAQNSLQEFGAVEHQLPSKDNDRFTVVAARGGDDIWIEIRRRRKEPAAAVAVIAPVAVPAPEAVAAPPVAAPWAAPPPPVPEIPQAVQVVPVVIADPVVEVDPVVIDEPVVTVAPVIDEPVVIAEPVTTIQAAIEETAVVAEAPTLLEAVIDEPVVVEAPPPIEMPAHVAMAEVEPAVIEPPPAVAPPPVEMPAQVAMAAVEPPIIEPTPFAPPWIEIAVTAAVEPAAVVAPLAVEPAPIEMPTLAAMAGEEAAAMEPPPAVAPPAFEAAAAVPPPAPAPPPPLHVLESVVLPMTRSVRWGVSQPTSSSRFAGVERLLRLAAARGASALYLTSESRPYLRVDGGIRILEDEGVLKKTDVEAAALEIGPENGHELVRKREGTEWIAELPELGRIRCTSFQDHHGPGVLFRMIATRAATAEQLGLSREMQALATEAEGLVLVAGPPASGKSTLISALVDLVNRQRADHVITLERQIRLVHDNRKALVSQREIRGSADEALSASRAALRENPDVLIVDDLISAQMVPLLLEAAGQGLLVMVSITAPSTAEAVERFVDLAPPETRAAVQAAMSQTFRGAVAQVLLKKTGGGRVTAREVLLGTASVARLIADGQLGQLPLALESGRKHGMMPMTDALLEYVQTGVVDSREAFRKAPDGELLIAGLKREGIDTSAVERLA